MIPLIQKERLLKNVSQNWQEYCSKAVEMSELNV